MSKKRWTRVAWGVERVVISDVLPYELPVAFGNMNFAETLSKLDVRWQKQSISANWLGPSTPALLSILLGGLVTATKPSSGVRIAFEDPRLHSTYEFPRARALSYNIGKNAGGVRAVALMHPRTQMAVVDFYRRHADTILYYTNRSSFSIRYPTEVARYTVSRDGVFSQAVDASAVGVEQHDHEYDQLRSYFTYGGYSHIHKFHESAEMRRLERRFPRLIQVDVTRCFDSIYTHTISWVTNGIEDSKARTKQIDDTFGGRFDKLMQSSNDLETHGILIGPEVSRIFAEIILQEVDVRVERILRAENRQLVARRDYEIRRFVDDYFIFCSSEEDAKRIVTVLGNQLQQFKMYLNDSKRKDELTPLASPRSVAKYQLKQAIRGLILFKQDDPSRLPLLVTSAENLLLEYKGILLRTGLGHADVLNYALVQIEFAFESALDRWRRSAADAGAPNPVEKDWTRLAMFISSVVDVTAAIFAGGVSASHSVKVARIAYTALKFMGIVAMPYAIRASVESKIASELSAHVRRPESDSDAPMHALVLLDALASMDEDGALDATSLRELLNVSRGTPNAIALLTCLRYCRERADLISLRAELEGIALDKAKGSLGSHSLDTGASILAAALLDSPFVSSKTKRDLTVSLKLSGNPRPGGRSTWVSFFDWNIPDYYEALQRKRGGDVY